jgi:translocation and assembly module TamB
LALRFFWRRLLAPALLTALLLALGLPALLLGLAASESGSRGLLILAQSFTPLRIPAEGIQGSLLGELQLKRLHYAAENGQRLDLAQLRLQWNPAALLQGRLHLQALELQGLNLQLAQTDADAEPEATPAFQPPALPLALQLDLLVLEQAQLRLGEQRHRLERLQLSAHSRGQQLIIDRLRLDQAGALRQLNLQGGMELRAPYPINIGLALAAEHQQTGTIGAEVRLTGHLQDYRLEASAHFSGAQLPAVQARLQARGDLQRLRIEQLRLATLQGQLQLEGQLGWQPQLSWDLRLEAQQLQPGSHWPEIPGRLSGRIHSQGLLDAQGPRFEAQIERLQGEINQQQLSGSGQLSYAAQRLQIDQLQLQAGDNRLQLQGSLAEQADFQLQLEANHLAELLPQLQGQVQASGRVQGQLSAPQLQLEAKASDLAYGPQRIGRLEAAIRWHPQRPEDSHSRLRLEQIWLGETLIQRLQLEGPGNLASHDLNLELAMMLAGEQSAEALSGKLRLKGGYAPQLQGWSGQLLSGHLQLPQVGQWRLQQPFALQASAKETRLAPHCWRNQAASACLQAGLDAAAKLSGQFDLKGVSLALAQPFLPQGDTISGELDLTARLGGDLTAPQVDLRLSLPQADYRPKLDATPLQLQLRKLQLQARLQGQRLQGDYRFELRANSHKEQGQWGQNSGRLGLDLGQTPAFRNSQLRLDLPDIGPLTVFLPNIQDLKGRLAVQLDLNGPLQQPRIKGEAHLQQAGLKVPDLGIQVQDIELRLGSTAGTPLNINGQARSGNGRLQLSGQLDPSATPLRLALNIRGERFQVARIPLVEAEISPDLELNLRDNRLRLSGKLHLPKAIIGLKEIPQGSVALSDDAVILDEKDKPQKKDLPAAHIASQIQLSLGDEVRFTGFGLKTDIRGGMEISTTPGHPPQGNGTLSLVNGQFKAFGQDLKLEQGRFLFAGPLNRPSLDIRAVRADLTDIKAGVLVSGQASNPRVEVFSLPTKSTAEALAYLLTGSGLSSSSFDEAAAIRSAAWSMERAGANMLTNSIAKKLGLSEVSFGGDSLEDSALSVGKRLSPDLYVRYVQNLFDNESTVELAYKLNKMLDIKVYGGSNQGVDLYYHREK